jgi:hypothetical protein
MAAMRPFRACRSAVKTPGDSGTTIVPPYGVLDGAKNAAPHAKDRCGSTACSVLVIRAFSRRGAA